MSTAERLGGGSTGLGSALLKAARPVSGRWGSGRASTATVFAGVAVSGGPGSDVPGLGSALLGAARPVHGSWGSGRLLRTSLISVLITNGGTCLIGAVQPSVLYADAAQLG